MENVTDLAQMEIDYGRLRNNKNIVKRRKNFTEKEKAKFYEIIQQFHSILESKNTDARSIEAKRDAWMIVTRKYNGSAETGPRTSRQLHALYDNLKKKAKSNICGDDSKSLGVPEAQGHCSTDGSEAQRATSTAESIKEKPSTTDSPGSEERPSPCARGSSTAPRQGQRVDRNHGTPNGKKRQRAASRPAAPDNTQPIAETLHAILVKRNIQKEKYENIITSKKLQILDIQMQQELIKLEKDKVSLDAEINLKQMLIQSAKLEVEIKRRNLRHQLDSLGNCSDFSL